MNIYETEEIRENMEFRLSLLRLMTVPYGEREKSEGESQMERLCSLAGASKTTH